MNTDIAKTNSTSHLQTVIPLVDIIEQEETYIIKAELPGVDKDNLDICYENSELTIKGTSVTSISDEPIYYREFNPVQYERTFQLGEGVDIEKIDANLNNGVLELTLPKLEKVKPRRIEVKSN